MDMMEIVLLVAGCGVFILSFLIPMKNEESSEETRGLAKEEIKALVSEELEAVRGHVDDVVEEAVTYSIEKTERSLERLSNEKIMAVNEYSDTVLAEIHKNHEEVMFLYDMLNDKHINLKNTVSEVNRTVKEVKETKKEAEEVVNTFQRLAPETVIPLKVPVSAMEPQVFATMPQESVSPAVPSVFAVPPIPAAVQFPEGRKVPPVSSQSTSPMSQKVSTAAQQASSMLQQSQPVSQQESPVLQQSQPVSQQESSMLQQPHPVPQQESPVLQQTRPVSQQESPALQQVTPVSQRVSTASRQTQPVSQQAAAGTHQIPPVSSQAALMSQKVSSASRKMSPTPQKVTFSASKRDAAVPQTVAVSTQEFTAPQPIVEQPTPSGMVPDSGAPQTSSVINFTQETDGQGRNYNDRVLELYKSGKSNVAIARELNLGVGEVKLVIDLYKNRSEK